MSGQVQVCVELKVGYLSSYRFVAKYWEKPASFFEARGISRRHWHKMRQELKLKYPEILKRVNPTVLST